MTDTVKFPGPRSYTAALAMSPNFAMIPHSMAAALLDVEVSTVQGYIRRGMLQEVVIGPDRRWVGVLARDVKSLLVKKSRDVVRVAKLIKPILLDAAKNHTTVEYAAALMAPIGLDHTHSRDRDLIGKALGRVSTKTHKTDERLLSVLAVRKDTGMPNSAFFGLAKDLGSMSETMSEDVFFRRERKAVFAAYG
jgi:hypothetical protein